jgi:hypothetical protein
MAASEKGIAMYYDRTGNGISEDDWKTHWADADYKVLARTEVGEWTVAAWWAGVDDEGGGSPHVFRTALLAPPRQAGFGTPLLQEWRHRTTDEAIGHHDRLVALMEGDEFAGSPETAEPAHSCHCH